MNTHTLSFERTQKYKREWHYKSVVDIEPSQSRLLLWLQVCHLRHSSGWREVGLSCSCQYLKFRLEEICWFASRKYGVWTRTLLDVICWTKRSQGDNDLYLSQLFSGYLFWIQRVESRDCRYCDKEDTAEQAVLECERWEILRRPFLQKFSILRENIVF